MSKNYVRLRKGITAGTKTAKKGQLVGVCAFLAARGKV
jgi:hypothetical protein